MKNKEIIKYVLKNMLVNCLTAFLPSILMTIFIWLKYGDKFVNAGLEVLILFVSGAGVICSFTYGIYEFFKIKRKGFPK